MVRGGAIAAQSTGAARLSEVAGELLRVGAVHAGVGAIAEVAQEVAQQDVVAQRGDLPRERVARPAAGVEAGQLAAGLPVPQREQLPRLSAVAQARRAG